MGYITVFTQQQQRQSSDCNNSTFSSKHFLNRQAKITEQPYLRSIDDSVCVVELHTWCLTFGITFDSISNFVGFLE